MRDIAKEFEALETKLSGICPEGRHLSLCKTQLELACMYAKKAAATRASLQKDDAPAQ